MGTKLIGRYSIWDWPEARRLIGNKLSTPCRRSEYLSVRGWQILSALFLISNVVPVRSGVKKGTIQIVWILKKSNNRNVNEEFLRHLLFSLKRSNYKRQSVSGWWPFNLTQCWNLNTKPTVAHRKKYTRWNRTPNGFTTQKRYSRHHHYLNAKIPPGLLSAWIEATMIDISREKRVREISSKGKGN